MEDLQHDHLNQLDLQIDRDVREQLSGAARWTKFISIVMFVACGLLLLFGTLGGAALYSTFRKFGAAYNFFGDLNGAVLIVVVIIVVAAVAAVYYFLYNFSRKIKNALLSDNTAELNEGLKSLKVFFIVTTIFAILSLLSNISNLFY